MEREDKFKSSAWKRGLVFLFFANEMCSQSSRNFIDPKYRQKFAPKELKFSLLEKTENNFNEDDRSQLIELCSFKKDQSNNECKKRFDHVKVLLIRVQVPFEIVTSQDFVHTRFKSCNYISRIQWLIKWKIAWRNYFLNIPGTNARGTCPHWEKALS